MVTAYGVEDDFVFAEFSTEVHADLGVSAFDFVVHGFSDVVWEAAAAGDENVVAALRRAGTYLGIDIANIATTLHPELIVIGGGVANIGDVLLDPARELINHWFGVARAEGGYSTLLLLAVE